MAYNKLRQLKIKKNKFGAKTQTYNGYSYHSKKEANYARHLDILKKGKAIKDWKRQVKIELFGEKGTRVCNYFMDFVVYHNGKIYPKNTVEYVEVKGFVTSTWALKWKLFKDKMGKQKKIKITLIK